MEVFLKEKEILIITYNWPPKNAIGTHRPYSWAKYWSQNGSKITVLTAKKYGFDEPLDLNLAIPPGVEVIELDYAPRLSGWTRFFLNKYTKKMIRWLLRHFRKRNPEALDLRKAWDRAAFEWIKNQDLNNFNVVVSTYGPETAHIIGYHVKSNYPDILWVADYRDLWSQNHIPSTSKEKSQKNEVLEVSTVGRYADLVTTVSQPLAASLSTLLGKRACVINNGFDIEKEDLINNITGKSARAQHSVSNPITIVHTGTIYDGFRNPEPVLLALKQLYAEKKIRLGDVTIDFYGQNIEPVKKLADTKSNRPFIRIFGHVPREEALRAQREASLLLLLESGSTEAKGVLTGKLFEYMSSGSPVLSIGSLEDSAIAQVLRQTDCGYVAGVDVAKIKEVLWELIDTGLPKWYVPKIDEIMKYSRKSQALKMYGLIFNRCG